MVGHKGKVTGCAFSGNGKRIASVGDGMSAHILWSINKGTHMTNLAGHKGICSAVAWHPSKLAVVSGCEDGTCLLWDVGLLDEVAEKTQVKKTSVATYNDESCKIIVQSYQKYMVLPEDK